LGKGSTLTFKSNPLLVAGSKEWGQIVLLNTAEAVQLFRPVFSFTTDLNELNRMTTFI
jgi:hypothetical protein